MNYPVITLNQLRPVLQGFRKSKQLTQAALAAKLGIAQQTYAKLESNPAAVSVERLFQVLRALDVEWILSEVVDANISTPLPRVEKIEQKIRRYDNLPAQGAAAEPLASKPKQNTPKRAVALASKKRENW